VTGVSALSQTYDSVFAHAFAIGWLAGTVIPALTFAKRCAKRGRGGSAHRTSLGARLVKATPSAWPA